MAITWESNFNHLDIKLNDMPVAYYTTPHTPKFHVSVVCVDLTHLLVNPGMGVGSQVPRPTCVPPTRVGSRVNLLHIPRFQRTHPQIPDSL